MPKHKYYSVENRPIEVHAFGTGPKTTLIMAGVHGDEHDGVDVVRGVLSRLSKLHVNTLEGQRIVVMPCANPDGYAANTRQNANGIDINRNFPDKTFGTGKKSKKFNGGKSPASEPETKAILGVVAHFKPSLIISLHEALACVNYNGPCIRLARRISKATGLPAVGDVGYPTPGSMGNYFGFDKRLPVITLELPKEKVDVAVYASIILSSIVTSQIVNSKSQIVNDMRPSWIKAKAPDGAEYRELKRLVESSNLHTVCQSACCPNIGECWRARTATFMILGNTCTRNCRFCAVQTGSPDCVDADEPRRVAEAVAHLGLKHAVITSVTRDDLRDGGANIFSETIRLIHENIPGCSVEVLIPDLQGDWDALSCVVEAKPNILNHNIETVERCYPEVRPQAIYSRSIDLLRQLKGIDADMRTKSGLMVGVGETWDELLQAMRDLRSVDCEILTIGQYLAPSKDHLPISRYYTPEEFDELKRIGLEMRFGHVESAPLVRSSYHAADQTA